MKKTLLILSIITLVFAGCKKFDVIEASKVEIIEENIEKGSDYIKINVEYDYPVELEAVTLYLSEKEDMSGAESYSCNVEGKKFSVEIEGLKEGVAYYYCYEYDDGYNKVKCDVRGSFTTMYCGHEYVDLGLSVKWATCNVGANAPEEYGNYYAWGETEPAPNNNYSFSNCPTYWLSTSELQSQGYIDSNGNLTAQYDAATANWGGYWRMPTYDELNELCTNCTWTWTTQNGVNGYNVEGPNGNSIFLPAAGYRSGSSLYFDGSFGYYWSSTPIDDYAYYLYFFSFNQYMDFSSRYDGLSVRPVYEESDEPGQPVQYATVTTSEVTNIKATTATCGGNVTSDGNGIVSSRGVCWSTSSNPTINNNKTINGSGTGSFTSTLNGLSDNTKYYVRAYVTNEKGTSYGEEISFTTQEITLPTVTTNAVTNIKATTATCGGDVTSDGNATVTARGLCWSTLPEPSINNIYDEMSSNGSGTGSFTYTMTDLKANTTYYVRAYATNEKGTVYGEEISFKTLVTEGTTNGHGWVDLDLPSGLDVSCGFVKEKIFSL